MIQMSESGRKVTAGVVIAAFVVAIIGLALTPTVATLTTSSAALLANFSSAQDIIELIPLFWAILVLAIPVAAIGLYFKGV
jgi:hypothetical protein